MKKQMNFSAVFFSGMKLFVLLLSIFAWQASGQSNNVSGIYSGSGNIPVILTNCTDPDENGVFFLTARRLSINETNPGTFAGNLYLTAATDIGPISAVFSINGTAPIGNPRMITGAMQSQTPPLTLFNGNFSGIWSRDGRKLNLALNLSGIGATSKGMCSYSSLLPMETRRTFFDYDGDGRADVSVFRPSTGVWYLSQSANGLNGVPFGLSSDKIVPADYDGDGKIDVAVWREGAFAYFYILQSSTNSYRFERFGTTGDIPLTGDWDADGKTDLTVYRNGATAGAQSNFFYHPTGTPGVDFRTVNWGASGDKPVAADFDGDGKTDAAVFRPSNGIWYISRSLDNQLQAVQFGISTDRLVPADYDGDGKADVAVFRPSNGTWYLLQSTAGITGIQFGLGTDLPVPADYDGDGKTDIAVFRNGTWYLRRPQVGFTSVVFGAATDKPIPNVFIP